MKCQHSHSNRANLYNSRSAKPRTAFIPLRMGLAALLLFSGGTVIPPTLAQANPTPLTAQAPAGATLVYVNPALGQDAPGAGSTNTPFRTISYALQQAQPGTTIQLADGSYTNQTGEAFPLRIPSGITLRGNEANKGQSVSIVGSGSYVSPTFARQNVTLRADNNSAIRGVSITNPASRGTALWVESTNPTIANSTFMNSLREGIFVSGGGTPKIENNIFRQNSANGISVAKAARPEIRGNLIEATGFGIAISGKSAPLVVNNRIVRNKDGLVISESAQPVLRNNIIEGNTRDGLVAISSALPDLGTSGNPGQNAIHKNGRHDVFNATRGNVIPAFGNQIDAKRVKGSVDLVAARVEVPPTQPSPPRVPRQPVPPAKPGELSDIQTHWARAYIQSLASQGVIKGFPDGTFRPNDPVTRAQFAAIVNQAFKPAPRRSPLQFSDIEANFWGSQPIQTAYQGGFLAGYPDGRFLPNQAIPRVQVLVAIANGLGLKTENTSILNTYQDINQIPGWAAPSVAAATQQEIVVNYPTPTQLNPNRAASRAEVAAFVYQALVQAGKAKAIDSPYLVRKP